MTAAPDPASFAVQLKAANEAIRELLALLDEVTAERDALRLKLKPSSAYKWEPQLHGETCRDCWSSLLAT